MPDSNDTQPGDPRAGTGEPRAGTGEPKHVTSGGERETQEDREVSPALEHEFAREHESARRFNRRVGLVLCAVYSLVYGGFVGIAAFATNWMDTIVLGGLNLAVVYGMVLIGLAFLLAMIYGLLCRDEAEILS